MCQYCEGKKPVFYHNRYPETDVDRDEIKISLENKALNVFLFKSHYDPYELDFDGDYGKFITDHNITKKVPVRYCPMCGRDLNQPKQKGIKTLQIKSSQVKKLLILLDRGIGYYPGNTTEYDKELVNQIKEQLKTKKK